MAMCLCMSAAPTPCTAKGRARVYLRGSYLIDIHPAGSSNAPDARSSIAICRSPARTRMTGPSSLVTVSLPSRISTPIRLPSSAMPCAFAHRSSSGSCGATSTAARSADHRMPSRPVTILPITE